MTEYRTRRQVLCTGVVTAIVSFLSGCLFDQILSPNKEKSRTTITDIEVHNIHSQPHTITFQIVAVSSKNASIKQKNIMATRTVSLPASENVAEIKEFHFKVTEQDTMGYLIRAKTEETNWDESYVFEKFETLDNQIIIQASHRTGKIDIYFGEEEETTS